jgi:hypothetical protein
MDRALSISGLRVFVAASLMLATMVLMVVTFTTARAAGVIVTGLPGHAANHATPPKSHTH